MAVWRYCFGVSLLTALVAAQLYDEVPPDEYSLPYQKNEIWRPDGQLQRSQEDEDPPIVLFRLLVPPQGDDRAKLLSALGNRQQESDPEEKFLFVPPKREVDPQGGLKSPATTIPFLGPQRKEKSRKGRKEGMEIFMSMGRMVLVLLPLDRNSSPSTRLQKRDFKKMF